MLAKMFWLAMGVAVRLALAAAPARAEVWQCAKAAHFTLYAQGSADSVAHMARDLERMAELLAGEGMGSTSPVRPRVFMIAFPDRLSFAPHQPLENGKRVQLAGYAESTPYAHWIGYIAGEQQGRWTANHEFVHTVAAELFQNVPTCLNEGMAEFYSTSYADAHAIHYGAAIPWHREMLRQGGLFSLDDLFGPKARSLAYAGGRSSAMFYAESWVLVHDLVSHGGPPHLRRFAELTASGTPAKDAMAQVYPELSWAGLPNQLQAYAADDEPFKLDYQIPVAGELEQIPVAMHVADPAEVAVHTGLWRMQPAGADIQLTQTLFDQARKNPQTEALATDGFGLLALQGGTPRTAEKEFRSAASDPQAEPLALTIAGAGLLQIAGQDTAGRMARIDEALAILERSIDKDSLDACALAWYGEGAMLGGRFTPRALTALERASVSIRGDQQLARALALARQSGAAAARGIPTGQAAIDSVNARVETGRYDAALSLMEQMEQDATDPAFRQKLHDERAQVTQMRDQNAAIDAYNRGVEALRKYDFVAAAREFDTARESARDTTLRQSASQRLEEIPSYEAFQSGLDAVKKNHLPAALSAFQHARELAKNDQLRAMCDQNIARLKRALAENPAGKTPAH